ncbi:complement factor I isoform X1 [Chiroxiphia lanceolata]|uniref:complement factor I isoform X1 n=1 Tax=Chiroxiphia lanceolata TaxID=296741 RepID=UPI0013CF0D88|nr:complement factor I isoform X1 [Chiroxiphia lanceolata]
MRMLPVCLVFFSLFCLCGSENAAPNAEENQFQQVEPTQPAEQDTYLIGECLSNQYTHKSCKKVFCHPWERCVEGKCLCKLPYQCPKNGSSVCSTNGKNFHTYCQLKSYECQQPKAKFLHKGKCMPEETFSVSLVHGNLNLLQVKPVNQKDNSFVCATEWTMNEANVACKHLGFELGAEYYQAISSITESALNSLHCLQITCRGLETSLAECHTEMKSRDSNEGLVSLQCYVNLRVCSDGEFHCVNKKCISLSKTCDGINDCGDLSDELCCRECRDNSFHCRSNICIPNKNVCNQETDCLTGEDEARVRCAGFLLKDKEKGAENNSMDEERRMIKTFLPQAHCGVTNHTLTRRKRIVGGEIAKKGEFPWQVAIKDTSNEGTTVYCGGVYIGGCWVLTAAHCVRANRVHLYRVWVGMLNTIQYDKETHTFRLKQLIIHENYNASTYENDIALLELSGSGNGECSPDHNSIPACIPWSEYMFKTGDRCKISGWGLEKGYTKQFILKWGNVNIFQNCSALYPGRFFKKMECAGTYDGSTDSCKGDSGGPLVCYDAENVAYVWGIVSWGENCGEAGHPGVYTKVASYYDWISHHVTRSLIARYNI